MTPTSRIDASHRLTELVAELRAAEDAPWSDAAKLADLVLSGLGVSA